MTSWLRRLFRLDRDVAQQERPQMKVYFNAGMDQPYDFEMAVRAAKRARQREIQRRTLAAKACQPKAKKPADVYVMPIRKVGK